MKSVQEKYHLSPDSLFISQLLPSLESLISQQRSGPWDADAWGPQPAMYECAGETAENVSMCSITTRAAAGPIMMINDVPSTSVSGVPRIPDASMPQ